ncbi:hypothetical protein [Sinomonas notoginsengisoli]|uniref:hypothetical protein n=1 Tax=Sinomonas notoginsengisoli TaxID=1457311 RepID=UPI001F43E410|nr:hypothetical protein [Sinomonas notoginsengisoli]
MTDKPTYPIAAAGTLDAILPGRLAQTIATAVGYGTEVRKPDSTDGYQRVDIAASQALLAEYGVRP